MKIVGFTNEKNIVDNIMIYSDIDLLDINIEMQLIMKTGERKIKRQSLGMLHIDDTKKYFSMLSKAIEITDRIKAGVNIRNLIDTTRNI